MGYFVKAVLVLLQQLEYPHSQEISQASFIRISVIAEKIDKPIREAKCQGLKRLDD